MIKNNDMKKYKSFKEFKEKDKHFKVAIFGSSRIKEGDALYKEVKKLASELAQRNITVLTGGGPGLMRAGNEGHKEGKEKSKTGAHSVGIGVVLPWKQKFNDSIDYKEEFDRFSKRLDEFMSMSNAVVVAPGGLGTILELAYTWQLVQVHHICNIPIILMGSQWKGFLSWIKKDLLSKNYLDKKDYELVFCVKNYKEALKLIEKHHKLFKGGGDNFCFNKEKYKTK